MKYYGFVKHCGERPIRIRIYVPTDIREDLVAIIKAYDGNIRENPRTGIVSESKLGRMLAKAECPLKYMPEWNTELQTYLLRYRDEKNLEKEVNAFLKELRNK